MISANFQVMCIKILNLKFLKLTIFLGYSRHTLCNCEPFILNDSNFNDTALVKENLRKCPIYGIEYKNIIRKVMHFFLFLFSFLTLVGVPD